MCQDCTHYPRHASLKLAPPPPSDDAAPPKPFPSSRLELDIFAKALARVEGITYSEAIARLDADQQREEAAAAAARERTLEERDEKARREILAAMERGVPFADACKAAGVKDAYGRPFGGAR